jgi:hypothetical protein
MALTSAGYFCNVTITDASGVNKANLSYDIVAADIATAKTNAAALVAEVDNVSQGLVVSYRIGEKFEEDTDQTAPAGVQIEDLALVSVVLETDNKKYSFKIPAPDPALFLDTTGEDSNVIDTSNANLQNFIGLFTDKTGYTTPGDDAIALVSDGEKVLPDNTNDRPSIRYGKRIHRASRKG